MAANMRYEGELRVIWVVKEGENSWFEKVAVPVTSFEVDGGAKRTINLGSTDDIALTSEFEQARMFKNITFFIPPTKDFSAAKLIGLRTPQLKFFEITFVVSMYSKGKTIQTLWLISEGAWFVGIPTPVGGTPPLLKAEVNCHEAHLLHGHLDRKGKMIHEAM